MKSSLLIFAAFLSAVSAYDFIEKDRYPRIQLIRKRSTRHQIIEHHEKLKQFGYNFDSVLEQRKPGPPRTNDSINLFRYLDNEFYGQIVIGHPGKTMFVAFDTAWTLSWVLSAKCKPIVTPGCGGAHNLYDHDRSSYWKKNGTKYFSNDGDFNYTGFYSYENISMAHSNVTNFLFVEMVTVPDTMAIEKADGVLGLGIKDADYEPFLYTLYRQKKIKDLMFSIYLNRDRQSNRGGNIMLGFMDQKHVHKQELKNKTIVPDPITYLPVDAGEYWQFSVDKIDFVKSKKDIVKFCVGGCKAIADTSSNEIIGPNSVIDQIHDIIKANLVNGSWIVDCDTINKLPKIDFYLKGVPFRLSGKQYIMRESFTTHTVCISAFTPSTTPGLEDMWVLGGAFLAQYYSIYNIMEKTIGFVRAA